MYRFKFNYWKLHLNLNVKIFQCNDKPQNVLSEFVGCLWIFILPPFLREIFFRFMQFPASLVDRMCSLSPSCWQKYRDDGRSLTSALRPLGRNCFTRTAGQPDGRCPRPLRCGTALVTPGSLELNCVMTEKPLVLKVLFLWHLLQWPNILTVNSVFSLPLASPV